MEQTCFIHSAQAYWLHRFPESLVCSTRAAAYYDTPMDNQAVWCRIARVHPGRRRTRHLRTGFFPRKTRISKSQSLSRENCSAGSCTVGLLRLPVGSPSRPRRRSAALGSRGRVGAHPRGIVAKSQASFGNYGPGSRPLRICVASSAYSVPVNFPPHIMSG